MNVPSPAPARVQLDSAGHLDQDVICIRCGYNLRGLSLDRVCPECGTPIGRSLHGDLLRFAPPIWLAVLISGVNWILAGMLVKIIDLGLSLGLKAMTGQRALGALAHILLTTVGVIGYWKVT